MARHGKKHKVGGKHRSAARKPRSKHSSTFASWSETEDESTIAPTLVSIARRGNGSAKQSIVALRHQTIGFVKASDTQGSPHDDRERGSHSSEDCEDTATHSFERAAAKPASQRTIRIASDTAHTSEMQLLNAMVSYGDVEWCEIIRSEKGIPLGVSRVIFTTQEAASKALEAIPLAELDSAALPASSSKASVENDASNASIRKSRVAISVEPTSISMASERKAETMREYHSALRDANRTAVVKPPSDSEEEIIFAGRRPVPRPTTYKTNATRRVSDNGNNNSKAAKSEASAVLGGSSSQMHASLGPRAAENGGALHSSLFLRADQGQAAIEDYIENTHETSEDPYSSSQSSSAGVQSMKADSSKPGNKTSAKMPVRRSRSLDIERVLSKRESPSGLQYLVVVSGSSIDEAVWVEYDSVRSEAGRRRMRAFDNEEKLAAQFLEDAGPTDNDVESEVDEGGDSDTEDSFLDEKDLIERKLARMSDERIARLLAKQEELGMGSDELILFDDEPDDRSQSVNDMSQEDTDEEHEDEDFNVTAAHDDELFTLVGEGSSFDVADFDRPSLRVLKGRKKSSSDKYVSDSELDDILKATWEADRRKKKVRKVEREEARRAGLLGKRASPRSAGQQSARTEVVDMRLEVEAFMMDDTAQQLSLPPMDKRDRKAIHEFSRVLGLTSKSAGSGKRRFPMLYKTSRTPKNWEDSTLSRLFAKLERRFFPQDVQKLSKTSARSIRRVHARGTAQGTSYAEGEMVGAGAEELGTGNRGHAMLEKMGWTRGMVLGASGNDRGILQPIEHIVKKSRAGLG